MYDSYDTKVSSRLLTQAKTLSKRINFLFSTLNPYEVDIPNIGITFNNKLVEIIHAFKKSGVPLDDNLLIMVILNYLNWKSNEASLVLVNYRETFNPVKLMPFLSKETLEQRALLVTRYRALDDEVHGFTLEKNVVSAIKFDIQRDREKEKYGGLNKYKDVANELIENYKRDLALLGVSRETIEAIPSFDSSYGSI